MYSVVWYSGRDKHKSPVQSNHTSDHATALSGHSPYPPHHTDDPSVCQYGLRRVAGLLTAAIRRIDRRACVS